MILLMWEEETLRRGMTETSASESSMMVRMAFMFLVRDGVASKTTPSAVLREIDIVFCSTRVWVCLGVKSER